MLLYYITNRRQLGDAEPARRTRLLAKIAEAAEAGVDYVQLREKDLTARELEGLAREAVKAVAGSRTRLLVNSRCDIAIATGAGGVHLPAHDLPANEARAIFARAGVEDLVIGKSCHTADEVREAALRGADLAVFGPVFGKDDAAAAGPEKLRAACAAAASIPVLALGRVTLENARVCQEAGAAGVAAIRLFQQNDVAETIKRLRAP